MSDNTNITDQSSEREAQTDDTQSTEQDDAAAGLKSALDKERKAARDATRQLKTLQTRLDELEGKDKSDVERLTGERDALAKRADEAATKLRNANARTVVYDEVGALASPRAIYALIRDNIEFNDDDQPTNIDELVAREKKADPSLFKAAAGSGDGGKRDGDTREISPGLDRLTYAYEKNSKTASRR